MPEALMNVTGLEKRRESALTSRRVESMRLSVRSCFRAWVQRPSAIGAPARLMIASASARTCSQGPGSRPFHSTIVVVVPNAWDGLLVRAITRWPSRESVAHNAKPIKPVAPVTTMFIPSSHERGIDRSADKSGKSSVTYV